MIYKALTAPNLRTIVQIQRLMARSNIHLHKMMTFISPTVRIPSPLSLRLILMMNKKHQLREIARYLPQPFISVYKIGN